MWQRPGTDTTGLVLPLLLVAQVAAWSEPNTSVNPHSLTMGPTAAPTTSCSPYPLCDPASEKMRQIAPPLFQARMNTSAGLFTIEVNRSWAPHAANRFYNLVRLGFYDGVYFFRVIAGFVNQFGLSGDPQLQAHYCNDNTCPANEPSAPIPSDPIVAGGASNTRGTVSFSLQESGGVTGNGSVEIFINLANNSRLDPLGFTPFGIISAVEMDRNVDRLFSGYGEMNQSDVCPNPQKRLCRGPKLERMLKEGNAYLSKSFPKLSLLRDATIVRKQGDDDVVTIDDDL